MMLCNHSLLFVSSNAPRCKRNYNLFPDDRADALHPKYDGWIISTGPTKS